MADTVQQRIYGIDVGKDELVQCDWASPLTVDSIANEPGAIESWLDGLCGVVSIAIEPTSHYHRELLERAHSRGHAVYLVNPRQLAHYRHAIGQRHKTDPVDAQLLARFLAHESAQLQPYTPPTGQAARLWALIKRRATLIEARKQLAQSLADLGLSTRALMAQLDAFEQRLQRQILRLVDQLGWRDPFDRCRSIPGIGPINAAALVCAFHRGSFAHVDSFIAFIGLDVRRRSSGRFAGQQKLTKHGEAEIRRLLFCAAMACRSFPPFARFHQQQLDKSFSKTAANCILARKLARIAFALIKQHQSFDPSRYPACAET